MKAARIFLPTNGGIFFVLLLGLFLFERPLQLLSDGGTCRHILTGQFIFENGHLPATNYITKLFANSPWNTTSVLSDTIYGAMYNALCLNGLVAISALTIALSVAWCYQMARARGMSMPVGMIMAIIVMFVTSLHWVARPHIFTYLTMLAEYYVLFMSKAPLRSRLVSLFVLQALWVNLHGSYYLGVAMAGAKLVGDFVQDRSSWKFNGALMLAMLAGSLVNISGGTTFWNIGSYMHVVRTRFQNDEFRSIDLSVGPRIWLFLLMGLAQAVIWIRSPKKPALAEVLCSCGFFALGAYSMRIIPYYALMMPVASAAAEAALEEKLPAKMRAKFAKLTDSEPTDLSLTPLWLGLGAMMLACWLTLPSFRINNFDPAMLPVTCVEKMHEIPPGEYGFTRDNWAGYVYLNTHLPVFMDDYHHFYPVETMDDYSKIYFTDPGWQQVLAKYDFKWILVPSDMNLQLELRKMPEWQMVCADKVGALFRRSSAARR